MDSYEQLLAQRQALQKLAALTGQRDLAVFAELGLLAGDHKLVADVAQLLQDEVLLTQPPIHSFLPGPDPLLVSEGKVLVGHLVPGGSEVRLPLSSFSLHWLIVGTIGKGKSTLAFELAKAAMDLP